MKKKMLHVRMRRGFTIIEVLMALGLVLMVATMVTSIQMHIFDRMQDDQAQLDRIFLLKQSVIEALLQTPVSLKKMKKDIEKPETVITLQPVAIEKKSSLAPWTDNLVLLQAEATWKNGNISRAINMVAIALKPPQNKEQKQ